jgi:hypothetical protein
MKKGRAWNGGLSKTGDPAWREEAAVKGEPPKKKTTALSVEAVKIKGAVKTEETFLCFSFKKPSSHTFLHIYPTV